VQVDDTQKLHSDRCLGRKAFRELQDDVAVGAFGVIKPRGIDEEDAGSADLSLVDL
jgi:hypothetical protein